MPDYRIFKATLKKGRFVFGFGAAFNVTGEKLDTLSHMTGGGHGHGHSNPHGNPHGISNSDQAEPLNEASIKRIVDHMNAGHVTALVNYAKSFGGELNTTVAKMTNLDEKGFDLDISVNGNDKKIRILFKEEIHSAADAHDILVEMAVSSK